MNRHDVLWIASACVIVAVLGCYAASTKSVQGQRPAISVTNHKSGSTVRYPVPLLCGTLADEAASSITVINQSSNHDTKQMKGLAHKGRFKALTELVPGENKLLLRAGDSELPLTLFYKPQTNPYFARVVYFTDQTGKTEYQTPVENDAQDYQGKLETAMKILQTFTAERMYDLGFGRITFNLELDANGKVKVHTVKADHPAEYYYKADDMVLYSDIAGTIDRKLPHAKSTNLAIPAFTRFDPRDKKVYGHTALGGGDLAVFGGGNLFAWPSRLADVQTTFMDTTRVDTARFFSDSVDRHTFWAIASTNLGAALHELGHTFALPHSRAVQDIMTRGMDRLNRAFTLVEPPHASQPQPYEFKDDEVACWAPVSAAALVPCRFFATDARPYTDENKTAINADIRAAAVTIESGNGICYVGLHSKGDAVDYIPLDIRKAAPKKLTVTATEIGKRVGTDDMSLYVIDDQGLVTGAGMKELLGGPFVKAWRFASTPQPWPDAKAFPPVDDAKLKAIVASARSDKLAQSRTSFVDFSPNFPPDKREFVAGYAVRTIRTDAARKVRIWTGSDDALRIWLNGKLVKEVLELRGAKADAESTDAELQVGEDTLVVEVSQAGGGWGLFLRLEDASGAAHELADDGRLTPVDMRGVERFRSMLKGPFVRDWRFATATYPWESDAFVELDAEKLKAIEASAASAKLAKGDPNSQFVNFAANFPAEKRSNVAGYALRTIRTSKPRKVKLFTGSDDALRVWVNGRLVNQVLALRGAEANSESAIAQLEAGENRLLVEVSQGGGDWGLILRLEDLSGTSLVLTDDGELVAADARK